MVRIIIKFIKTKILGFVVVPQAPKLKTLHVHEIDIDVQGRRNIDFNECVEEYLIENGIAFVDKHEKKFKEAKEKWEIEFNKWEKKCEEMISKSRTRGGQKFTRRTYEDERSKAIQSCADEGIVFVLIRKIKQYRQQNNVRYPYYATQIEECRALYPEQLRQMYKKLESIGFETTTRKYHQLNQRKLMTQGIRDRIKSRDGYTCQICGRYMPDGVGLHIDHIIPISKGGKTVDQNLQVLCDKCNLRKSDKY